jgi:hypothetical protein
MPIVRGEVCFLNLRFLMSFSSLAGKSRSMALSGNGFCPIEAFQFWDLFEMLIIRK